MGKIVLLLFILVPLIETFLLARIGAAIGWANTIALVIATGIAGGWLARLEGLRTWRRWQQALAAGRIPDEGVLSGLLVLLGGALLITPGVVTDAVGLLLLLPPTRKRIAALIRPRIERRIQRATVDEARVRVFRVDLDEPSAGVPTRRESFPRQVIDAEFEVREAD